MRTYWVLILRHDESAEGCTLALSTSPLEYDADSSEVRTVSYKSWQQLSSALSQVGIAVRTLDDAEVELHRKGFVTLREIILSDDQLKILGFSKRS